MRKQKYFERDLEYNWRNDEKDFYNLLNDDWTIVLAIPIQDGKACHTYTRAIHYVLEKEVKDDE